MVTTILVAALAAAIGYVAGRYPIWKNSQQVFYMSNRLIAKAMGDRNHSIWRLKERATEGNKGSFEDLRDIVNLLKATHLLPFNYSQSARELVTELSKFVKGIAFAEGWEKEA